MKKTMALGISIVLLLPGVAQAFTDTFAIFKIRTLSQTIETSGDPVDIYYPEIRKSQRTASKDRFPVVIVLQGALVDNEYYSVLGQNIAKHGFVVLIPNHSSSTLGGQLFTENVVITQALQHARIQDTDKESPLYEITDTGRLGLAGHSFGTAAILYAVGGACAFPFCKPEDNFALPTELRAVAAIAGSAQGFPVDNTGIPVLMIYGAEDSSVPDNEAQYEDLVPPKAQVVVEGSNHFGLNDISEPPGANTDRGEPEQIIPQSISATLFGRWSGLYFRAHIKNDWQAWRKFYQKPNRESGITVTGEGY